MFANKCGKAKTIHDRSLEGVWNDAAATVEEREKLRDIFIDLNSA